jgi:glycosyltransferase involved in cell wall biosynthesis
VRVVKVLFLSPYPPFPPNFGGSTRIFNLMCQTARRHQVWSLSYESTLENVDLSGLREVVEEVVLVPRPPERKRWNQARSLLSRQTYQRMSHHSAAMQQAIDELVARVGIDVIVVEFSQMAVFDFPAGPGIIVDEHNVEADLIARSARAAAPSFRKLYSFVESRKFAREEVALLRDAGVVTVTSERDGKDLLLRDPYLRVHVVENGVDTSFFARDDGPGEADTLVFTGAMHYHPNQQGVTWFLDHVFPLVKQQVPGARFIGAGGSPPPELLERQDDSIEFTGYVDDIRVHMARGKVFVVPLLVGGGTRFKVVGAISVGRPVVSTRLGAEGIDVIDREHLLLADDPEAFARSVVELLRSPERAASLVDKGRVFVEQNYAWWVIGGRFEAALQHVAARREGALCPV